MARGRRILARGRGAIVNAVRRVPRGDVPLLLEPARMPRLDRGVRDRDPGHSRAAARVL